MSATPVPEERRRLQRRAADHGAGALPSAAPLPGDEPWRCADDLVGLTLETASGRLGVVTDLVFEEETRAVTGLVVATEGSPLVVPLGAVGRIDWPSRILYIASAPKL